MSGELNNKEWEALQKAYDESLKQWAGVPWKDLPEKVKVQFRTKVKEA